MKKIPLLNIVLFFLTFISTLTVGALHEGVDLFKDPLEIYKGLPFSFALLTILSAHELSHYYASRRHRVDATLPYFIPAPTLFGTFGAVIRMKSPITTKNALVDIGASGPIAGFIFSFLASVIGLSLSEISPVPESSYYISLGDSILFKLLSKLLLGTVPLNSDIFLHPVAFAGWIGFFITSINLIPVGQLDGGHIFYAMFENKHSLFSKILVVIMLLMGLLLWEGWIIWGVLLIILGLRHPPIMYSDIPLDPGRIKVGWISLVIFIVTFTPVPVVIP